MPHNGARPQITVASRHDAEEACEEACPQIIEASKQTDVTSKRRATALVLKLWKRAIK